MCVNETDATVTPLVRPLRNATVSGTSACSACGRSVTVQLRIEDGVIVEAGGLTESCASSRECLAALLETVKGLRAYDAQAVGAEDFAPRLGRPVESLGCDNWCVAALRIALRNWRLDIKEAA